MDGPEEFHLILLDNQRTQLLADAEQRDALHCIRCGACLNVCPIYRNIGGHSYATTYQGPIGSVITPHLRSLMDWKHLSYASSLCGACTVELNGKAVKSCAVFAIQADGAKILTIEGMAANGKLPVPNFSGVLENFFSAA